MDKKAEAQRENKGAAVADEGVETVHYWIYAPGDGATCWDEFYNAGIMGIGWDEIGNLSDYNTKSEMRQAMQEKIDPSRSFKNESHATWQFVNEMKPGDIIFAKKGMHQIIGRGIVSSGYEYDENKETPDQTLSEIVEFELAPLLKEYWFDEPTKAKSWIDDLRSAIK